MSLVHTLDCQLIRITTFDDAKKYNILARVPDDDGADYYFSDAMHIRLEKIVASDASVWAGSPVYRHIIEQLETNSTNISHLTDQSMSIGTSVDLADRLIGVIVTIESNNGTNYSGQVKPYVNGIFPNALRINSSSVSTAGANVTVTLNTNGIVVDAHVSVAYATADPTISRHVVIPNVTVTPISAFVYSVAFTRSAELLASSVTPAYLLAIDGEVGTQGVKSSVSYPITIS